VVSVQDAPGGQRRLVLIAVPRPASPLDAGQLATHLRGLLPHYMIPGQIHVMDELPLTANGKVDVARALAGVSAPASGELEEIADSTLAKQLSEVWADLLQIPAVDPDANFFALGGNSLLALRMVNRIRAELGVELPLGQVFEAPTVRQLAACVARGAGEVNCAVELSTGEGTQLFLFHVLGGSVTPYLPLARAWPGPVRGFQSRGLVEAATVPLPPDLETMAAGYREEMLRYQPEGPFVLGGWSMGGFLAYEVARQLSEQGHRAYLLMIDSDIPDITLPDTEIGRHQAFLINLTLGPPAPTAVAAIDAAPPDAVVRTARDTAVAHGLLPAEVDTAGYERLMRIHENDLRVVSAWQPKPLDQPAVLFVAEEEGERPDPVPFWRAVCPRIEVHTAPGDHFTIGAGDRLGELARRAAAWLADQRATLH
jgi:thioesterase domain-containing protein/acyl carrier protein